MSVTPGYCEICRGHNGKHALSCPALPGSDTLAERFVGKHPALGMGYEPPQYVLVNEIVRQAMTEKEKVEADHQTIGSSYNVKMICFTKACERMWSAVQSDKPDAPKPEMDQLIREADMLHDWLVNGKMPLAVTTNRKAMN